MQTLANVSRESENLEGEGPYIEPSANAPITASFLLEDIFNLLMGTIGMKKIAKSVATWNVAWLIQYISLLKQVPGSALFQARSTGL